VGNPGVFSICFWLECGQPLQSATVIAPFLVTISKLERVWVTEHCLACLQARLRAEYDRMEDKLREMEEQMRAKEFTVRGGAAGASDEGLAPEMPSGDAQCRSSVKKRASNCSLSLTYSTCHKVFSQVITSDRLHISAYLVVHAGVEPHLIGA